MPRRPFASRPASERIEDQMALGRRAPRAHGPAHGPGRCLQPLRRRRGPAWPPGAYASGVANDVRDRPPELLLVRVHPDLLRCIEDNVTVIGLRGAARDRIPDDADQVECDPCGARSSRPTNAAADRRGPRATRARLGICLRSSCSGGVLIVDADMIQRGARADERGLELVSRTGDRQVEMLVARLRPVDGSRSGRALRPGTQRRSERTSRHRVGAQPRSRAHRLLRTHRLGIAR